MIFDVSITNRIISIANKLRFVKSQLVSNISSGTPLLLWSWPEISAPLSKVFNLDSRYFFESMKSCSPFSDDTMNLSETDLSHLNRSGISGFIIMPLKINNEIMAILFEEGPEKINRTIDDIDSIINLAASIESSYMDTEIGTANTSATFPALYKKILNEVISDVVLRVAEDGTIIDCMGYSMVDSGFSRDEIVGLNIVNFTLKDLDSEPWSSPYEVINYVLSAPAVDMVILYRSGEKHWLQARAISCTDRNGSIEYLCSLTDIHNYKVTEKKYNELKTLHDKIMENIIDVVWIIDLETLKYTYMSPSDERARGYSREEAMSKDIREIMPPEYHELFMAMLAEEWDKERKGIAPKNRYQNVPMLELCKDGSTFHSQMLISAIREETTGKPLELIGISRNIETQWKQEKELEHQKESFRALANLVSEGLVIWEYLEKENRIVPSFISQGVSKLTGYPTEEIAQILNSRTDIDMIFDSTLIADMEDFLFNRKPVFSGFKKTFNIKRADNSPALIEVNIHPFAYNVTETGMKRKLLTTAKDISDQRDINCMFEKLSTPDFSASYIGMIDKSANVIESNWALKTLSQNCKEWDTSLFYCINDQSKTVLHDALSLVLRDKIITDPFVLVFKRHKGEKVYNRLTCCLAPAYRDGKLAGALIAGRRIESNTLNQSFTDAMNKSSLNFTYATDLNLNMFFISKSASYLLGYEMSSLSSMELGTIMPYDSLISLSSSFENGLKASLLRNEWEDHVHVSYIKKDGNIIDGLSIVKLVYKNEKPAGFVVSTQIESKHN